MKYFDPCMQLTFLEHKFTSAMKVSINEYVSGQKLLLTNN